jgi:DNA mismatch endonuclease (patch repair protein)
MADVVSKMKRSQIMAAIKSKGNKATEIKLAGIFRKNKIVGWRRNFPLFGNPDFTFAKQRLAVFVDGCFWHGCPKHFRKPRDNRKYWHEKILRNQNRDRLVTKTLRNVGWRVLRIWEHELKNETWLVSRVWNLRSGAN